MSRLVFPKRRGFTAVEVIVAVAVLSIAVIPVFMSTTSGAKNVRLTEYHVIAQSRAKRLLEAYTTYGLEELRELSGGGGELPPPFSQADLDQKQFDLPPEYRSKMENFSESGVFEDLSADLGLVRVEIQWKIQGKPHEYSLFRTVSSARPAVVVVPPLGAP